MAIAKRMRAIKKKLGKAEQIEQQVAAGKAINADQEEVLKSKSKCLVAIEELSKLESHLKEAMTEEIALAKEAWMEEEAQRQQGEDVKSAAMKDAAQAEEEKAAAVAAAVEATRESVTHDTIQQLVPLIYFSKMFDQSFVQLLSEAPGERDACVQHLMQDESVRKQERFACYSWLNHTSPQDQQLRQQDMDLIVQLGKLLTARSARQLISHETAVQQCCALARKYLLKAGEVLPELGMDGAAVPTGTYVAEQVSKIMASQYFTVKPEYSVPQEKPPAEEQAQAPAEVAEKASEPAPVTSGAAAASSTASSASTAPASAPPAPATPEIWPYMLQPQVTAGMAALPLEGGALPVIGQVPVSHASVADQLLPGHPAHPYGQPGMPMNFGHPGGFMMPQHAGGMPPMMPPGAYDHMFQGMPYMPPPSLDATGGLPPMDGAGGLPNQASNGPPGLAGSSALPEGGPAAGAPARGNARQHEGGNARGRGGRNRGRGERGPDRGRGNAGGGGGGNRNRGNYDGGRGGRAGGANRTAPGNAQAAQQKAGLAPVV